MAVTAASSLSVWSSRQIVIFQSLLQTPVLMHIISDRFKKISTDFMLFIEEQPSQSLEMLQPPLGPRIISVSFISSF